MVQTGTFSIRFEVHRYQENVTQDTRRMWGRRIAQSLSGAGDSEARPRQNNSPEPVGPGWRPRTCVIRFKIQLCDTARAAAAQRRPAFSCQSAEAIRSQ